MSTFEIAPIASTDIFPGVRPLGSKYWSRSQRLSGTGPTDSRCCWIRSQNASGESAPGIRHPIPIIAIALESSGADGGRDAIRFCNNARCAGVNFASRAASCLSIGDYIFFLSLRAVSISASESCSISFNKASSSSADTSCDTESSLDSMLGAPL